MERKFASFYIGQGLYGLDVSVIREILRKPEITTVEKAPDYVRGLLNLRGQIVTVLDPGVKLGFGALEFNEDSRCIILKSNVRAAMNENQSSTEIVGLLTGRVGDMVSVQDSDVKKAPANVNDVKAEFIEGVINLEKELLVVLKVEQLIKE